MNDESYVYDTYALLAIIDGALNYQPYTNQKIVITEFILAELCFNLIRKMGKEKAYLYIDDLSRYIVSINKEVIKEAMEFRFNNLKKDISMTDCIGYFLAKNLGIKFLTGDKEFESMKDVEFVKK